MNFILRGVAIVLNAVPGSIGSIRPEKVITSCACSRRSDDLCWIIAGIEYAIPICLVWSRWITARWACSIFNQNLDRVIAVVWPADFAGLISSIEWLAVLASANLLKLLNIRASIEDARCAIRWWVSVVSTVWANPSGIFEFSEAAGVCYANHFLIVSSIVWVAVNAIPNIWEYLGDWALIEIIYAFGIVIVGSCELITISARPIIYKNLRILAPTKWLLCYR